MKILIILGVIIVLLLLLFMYSACVISSRCSRIEEQYLEKDKEEQFMSILQEYEENEKILGMGRIKAIEDYINYCKNNGVDILYSDIVYKQNEYEMFDKWFESNIKPFVIVNHTDKYYSLILDQVYFDKDIFNKKEVNGYDYEELIKSYVSKKLEHLELELNFDSEAGMFAVTSKDIKVIEELAYSFSKDSNDKYYIKSLLQDKELGYE